jgi:adenylosuccinate lyase
MLPDATALVNYMLERYSEVLDNLEVYPERMMKNIESMHGVIFAQRVMNLLIANAFVSRENAYDMIQPIAMKSYHDGVCFKELLLKDKDVMKKLSRNDIASCFTMEYYFDKIPYIYKKVLGK